MRVHGQPAHRPLNKSYGPARVLSDIALGIDDGEFVVLVGPSGCGKSTLLRMIAGLDAPSAGDIYIGGRLVNALAPAERKIAMVFQSYALYPHMNVRKNMTFGLKFTGVAPRRDASAASPRRRACCRLEQLLDRHPRDLSGGQRQRVAIGRAIVREPDVFLFDEPLSNLDAALRVSTRVEIARAASAARRDDRLRHPRPDRGDDARRPHRGDEPGPHRAGRQAARPLLRAGQSVRRRLHRLAGDEFLSGRGRPRRRTARRASPDAALTSFVAAGRAALERRRGADRRRQPRAPRLPAAEASSPPSGAVELVERLGEASFAYVRRADDKMMVVEVRGRETPEPGRTAIFRAPARELHLFDAEGRRIKGAG